MAPPRSLRTSVKKQEKMLQESRKSGTRSVEIALAEIQIISKNVYVERTARKLTEEEIPICSCTPPPNSALLGCLEDCVNRAVLVECIDGCCPCGDQCANQRIQRGCMPLVTIEDCGAKGLGLFARQEVRVGEFVGEYMGEIVTEKEYHMRRLRYHQEKHRYMMVLSGGEVIDATRMGGLARFINHSCEPNCGVEKWDVNGEERCGIFARRNIHYGEELTFDYKFESFSKLEMTECLCGSQHCRKVIGMNNKSVKPSSKTGAIGSVTHAGAPEKPRLLDPIGGKHSHGTKVADKLLDRITRTLFHRKLLAKREAELLRSSRTMLCRNFALHLDTNFRSLCLEQYFLADASAKLSSGVAVVPRVFAPRSLPGYPPKQLYTREQRKERKSHLENIVAGLYGTNGELPPTPPEWLAADMEVAEMPSSQSTVALASASTVTESVCDEEKPSANAVNAAMLSADVVNAGMEIAVPVAVAAMNEQVAHGDVEQ